MINLSGVFVEETDPTEINELTFYGFKLIFSTDTMCLYCETLKQRDEWIKYIKKATGYINIKDYYEVLVHFFFIK